MEYTPFKATETGEFDESALECYLKAEPNIRIVETIVIDPFDEKLKESDRDEWIFGGLVLKRIQKSRSDTRWKEVYEKIETFLEIRSDDSRAKGTEGVQYFDGLGYCISTAAVLAELEQREKEFTSHTEWDQIDWPRAKRNEPAVRSVAIPNRSYRQLNEENARIALACRRFRSGLEKEVIKAYKGANEAWLTAQTGWSKENIPPAADSPVERVRQIGKRYVVVQLIREENPQYHQVLTTLEQEMKSPSKLRLKEEKGDFYVNIKALRELLQSLYKSSIIVDCRYVIVP